jgi:hypothetical protein
MEALRRDSMKHYRKMPYKELIKEHEHLVKALSKSKSPTLRRLYKAQKKELAEYKRDYSKRLKR